MRMQVLALVLAAACGGATALHAASSLVLDRAAARGASASSSPRGGARGPASPYYWPHARGHPGRYSVTELNAPDNLTASLAWEWHHPDGRYHTTVVGAPLLDDEKNVYIASEDGFRKFSPEGRALWYFQPRGSVTHCPSLMDGTLFGSTVDGVIIALSMETGQLRWNARPAASIGGDTSYVESHDGVVVAGVEPGPGGGSARLVGLNAANGEFLWDYKPGKVLWNVMGQFTEDGSTIVMDVSGGVHKVGLHNGTLLWRADPPLPSRLSWTDGGVILGPDGTSYTCSNANGAGNPGDRGAVRAYALQDGRMLWEQLLDYPCNSWPAVTGDGASVVVPAGAFVKIPSAADEELMERTHTNLSSMHQLSLSLGVNERSAFGIPNLPAAIQAFDAKTGKPQWRQELEAYGRMAAAGDEEGFVERMVNERRGACLPAQFGAPTISGDGTVYVGRADGLLYGVRPSGDHAAVVQTFNASAGFLHPGTSFAPGMMAVTSCDGLFVWKM